MPDLTQIPDEYGLSTDSLRGSEAHINPQNVGNHKPDPFGRDMGRAPLSFHEARALELIGREDLIPDDSEWKPKPVEDAAPVLTQGPLALPPRRAEVPVETRYTSPTPSDSQSFDLDAPPTDQKQAYGTRTSPVEAAPTPEGARYEAPVPSTQGTRPSDVPPYGGQPA